jgi:hypothetical protein
VGAGREGQHCLAAVGVAPQGRPGGQHPHRAARMLADPAERDRATMMKRRDQRLQPLRDAHPGLVLAGGGVLAGVRPAGELGDLPPRQVPQDLPRSAVGHDVPRLHPGTMSVQSALGAGRALERLFMPGIRLGWTFRDRHGLTAPYPEPESDHEVLREQISERAAAAQARYARARRWVIKPSLALGLLLLLLAGYAEGRKTPPTAPPPAWPSHPARGC